MSSLPPSSTEPYGGPLMPGYPPGFPPASANPAWWDAVNRIVLEVIEKAIKAGVLVPGPIVVPPPPAPSQGPMA